jgi:hypothetical protein
MIADLERLHEEHFQAWQTASAMTAIMTEFMSVLRTGTLPKSSTSEISGD